MVVVVVVMMVMGIGEENGMKNEDVDAKLEVATTDPILPQDLLLSWSLFVRMSQVLICSVNYYYNSWSFS